LSFDFEFELDGEFGSGVLGEMWLEDVEGEKSDVGVGVSVADVAAVVVVDVVAVSTFGRRTVSDSLSAQAFRIAPLKKEE